MCASYLDFISLVQFFILSLNSSESRVLQTKQVGHGCAMFKVKYSSGRETGKGGGCETTTATK